MLTTKTRHFERGHDRDIIVPRYTALNRVDSKSRFAGQRILPGKFKMVLNRNVYSASDFVKYYLD